MPEQMEVESLLGVLRLSREKTLTSERSRQAEYRRRMEIVDPIHPEMFAGIGRPRLVPTHAGVLRLMATVISVLWQRGDQNLGITAGHDPGWTTPG